MKRITIIPMASVLLAISVSSLNAQGNVAETKVKFPSIVVTASRLNNTLDGASTTTIAGTSTTVVTAEEIQRSPGRTIPEILSSKAGVQFHDLYGSTNGAGQTVDMRGFGEPATANTLILINGRRLTDLDLAAVDFSSIPRESIDRIEVTRGNFGGVLYGGGAEGGAINIITKSNIKFGIQTKVDGGYGSDHYREFNFASAQNKDGFAISAYGNRVLSDGYRDNNYLKQKNLTFEIRRHLKRGDIFLNLNLDDQKLGLPGGRLVDPSKGTNDLTDPRGAQTPNDYALENGIATYIGGSYDLNASTELIVDASLRRKDQDSDFRNQDQARDTVLTTWGLTPRILFDTSVAGKNVISTMGLDLYYVDYSSDRKRTPKTAPFTRVKAYQYTAGFYNQSSIKLTQKLSTSVGLRLERMSLQIGDTAYPGNPGSYGYPQSTYKPTLSESENEYALNAGVNYQLTNFISLYGHVGRSYRTPTLDERSGTAYALNTFELKNQSSKEVQGGAKFRMGHSYIDTRVYFSRTRDEIRFDPDDSSSFGANENTDPINRYGLESNANTRLNDSVNLRGSLTLRKAEFANGPFEGKDIPLVPKIFSSVGVNWKLADWVSIDSVATYEGERRLANDEAGNFKPLRGFTLWDMKLHGEYKSLNWSAAISNLLDENYQTFGTASDTTPGRYSVQTLPGRTYFFRLGSKF